MPEIKTNPKSSNDLNSLFFRLPIDNVHDDSRQYLGIKKCISLLLSISLALGLSLSFSQGASAVSGGGLDYAGLDLTGQNFSNGNYKGKDFTQVIAKGTNFAKSNLQGCRFYKAYLVRAPTFSYRIIIQVVVVVVSKKFHSHRTIFLFRYVTG